eukprot:10453447-Lingulodinium_polyedra.AAC.1
MAAWTSAASTTAGGGWPARDSGPRGAGCAAAEQPAGGRPAWQSGVSGRPPTPGRPPRPSGWSAPTLRVGALPVSA